MRSVRPSPVVLLLGSGFAGDVMVIVLPAPDSVPR
jgi:hypothetical protein